MRALIFAVFAVLLLGLAKGMGQEGVFLEPHSVHRYYMNASDPYPGAQLLGQSGSGAARLYFAGGGVQYRINLVYDVRPYTLCFCANYSVLPLFRAVNMVNQPSYDFNSYLKLYLDPPHNDQFPPDPINPPIKSWQALGFTPYYSLNGGSTPQLFITPGGSGASPIQLSPDTSQVSLCPTTQTLTLSLAILGNGLGTWGSIDVYGLSLIPTQ